MNVEYEIKKIALTEGDTLVVKVDALLTQEMTRRVLEIFKPHCPPDVKLLVIDRQVEVSVIQSTKETTG